MIENRRSIPMLTPTQGTLLHQLLLSADNINLGVNSADWPLLLCQVGFHDREQALDPDAHPNAGHAPSLGIEHPNKAIVPATTSHAADKHLLVATKHSLIDHPGVVVKAPRQTQIKTHTITATVEVTVAEKERHVFKPSFCFGTLRKLAPKQLLHKFLASRHLNPLSDSIGGLCLESLLVHHLLSHLLPRCLVQFVNSTAYAPEHVLCYPTHLEYAIQDLPVVHFDHKLAHVDSSEDLVDNLDTLCVRDHGIVLSGNVEVTLVKLPESSTLDAWVVPSVDFGNVVSLDI